jgi:hypothetical protein
VINRRAFLGFVAVVGIQLLSREGLAQPRKVLRVGSLTLSAQPKFFTES